MLICYRVLDLTDEKGALCGKLIGGPGADVIKNGTIAVVMIPKGKLKGGC